MATVSMRYADALMQISDKYVKQLNSLAELYIKNEEFKITFDNPEISFEEKSSILETMFKDRILINFLTELLKSGRFKNIDDIAHKYEKMIDEKNGKINLEIVSAQKLSENDIKKIVKKFKQMLNANEISYKLTVDESVLGGLKVITDEKIYDDTVITKLKEML